MLHGFPHINSIHLMRVVNFIPIELSATHSRPRQKRRRNSESTLRPRTFRRVSITCAFFPANGDDGAPLFKSRINAEKFGTLVSVEYKIFAEFANLM